MTGSGANITAPSRAWWRNALVALVAASCFAGGSVRVFGQSVYGRIHGTVRDANGEPFSGAVVMATSEEKGGTLSAKTDARGHYEFPQVPPDTYDVRLEANGRKIAVTDVSVSPDDESLVDLRLPAQGQSGGPAGGSTLHTRADNAITLDRTAIANLPNYDQNSTRYGFLAPGTQLRGTGSPSQDPQNAIQLSINGQLPSATALVLDGTDNRDSINQLAVFNPALESLAEIRIITQSFDAETGQALSGVVIAQTRSGGNAWHGSGYEFRRSSWAEASNPNLQNPSLATPPTFKINLFGGSMGGPLVRNRLFVFGNYQGIRRSLGSTQVMNVPSDLVRNTCLNPASDYCDLSEYLPIPTGSNPPPPAPLIYDPLTGKPFPMNSECQQKAAGYCIPRTASSGNSGLSPQAISLLSLLPAPNIPAEELKKHPALSNYKVSGAEAWDENAFNVRVDQIYSSKLTIFGRYSYATYHVNSPSVFGKDLGGTGFGPDGGFAGQSRSPNHSLTAGFDYALKSNLYTDVRFGFFRRKISVLPNSYGTTPAKDAGIDGLNMPDDPLTSGMPAIQIAQPVLQVGSSNIAYGDGQAVNRCNCPLLETLQQFQWVNNWTKTRGNHTFKWGEDFRLAEDSSFVSPSGRTGTLSFALKDTAEPGVVGAGAGGLGLATFLIGDVSAFSRTVGVPTGAGVHQKRIFFYGQDTWRLTPKFTLSYGLRWETYFPQTATGKNLGGFLDLSTGMIQAVGYPGFGLSGNVGNSWNNLAPRVGVAYQLQKRTVIRAAYGRDFDAGTSFARNVTLNPPVQANQTAPTVAKKNYVFQFSGGAPGVKDETLLPGDIPASGEFKLLAGYSATTVPATVQVPTLDQWNLTVQHELHANFSFELAYIGNKATHVVTSGAGGAPSSVNLNQLPIAGFVEGNCYLSDTTTACLDRYPYYLRTYPDGTQFSWTQAITYAGGAASANYHAMQAKLVKRWSKGYEFDANYTWAKGIGYQSDYYLYNPSLNRGVNIFDRTHTFNLYNVLELPFGKGKPFLNGLSRASNLVVSGWSINTITTAGSGLPFSPSYNECGNDRDTGPCRPNQVGSVSITGDRNNYFTTTNGQPLEVKDKNSQTIVRYTIGPWQGPAVGTFGTAGYNSLRGPAYFDTDLAVEKNLTITERYSVQFRTDFVNVFNKVNLGLPSGCVDCAAGGLQTGAVIQTLAQNASQRQIEFAVRILF